MSDVIKRPIFDEEPGMGLNANPFEAEMYLDLTAPLGSLSGQYYSLMFQLGRNGFAVFKIDENIDVSPAFKNYYEITINQKHALEAQIKQGLGQIATAIHDYDLISHDLRKYKEYMDYYTKIEKGDKEMKSKVKEEKEKGEKLKKEGVQTLRSVFIDQVDAHTGEGIALRTITQRWPTIIVDFMRLDDEDVDQKKIATRHNITEAEGSVLATKNKLFLEWRDNLFKPTLKDRYQNVLRLVEARRTSITNYTEMLKPIIARFKVINDAMETPYKNFALRGFFQPGSQAYSIDTTRIWAFMPFAPAEKYKVTRDYLDEIHPKKAGFSKDQIEELVKAKKMRDHNPVVSALPVEPSIDKIVMEAVPDVEKAYGVKLSTSDIFDARKRLTDMFLRRSMDVLGGVSRRETGEGAQYGATWQFSPYFVFLDLPFERAVIKLPNGSELEDLALNTLTVKGRTQNVIIVTLLEIIAREKQLENYISQMLGEMGVTGMEGKVPILKSIEEIAKEQYPEIYSGEEKGKEDHKKKKEAKKKDAAKKTKNIFGDVLDAFGLKFDWLRARGPYEFAMDDRIAEMFQVENMVQGYLYVLRFLQKGAGVPGIRV